ncbi:MAG: hypothetical protein HUU55_10140 [Myxococcales bacterium]|nr:hypothetical protein [Myxococcales bacterium]
MELTNEEYIEIGDTLSSSAVITQTEFSLTLAERDAAGLAGNGWGSAKTEKLRSTLAELRTADDAYTKKSGRHTAVGVDMVALRL